MDTMKSYVNHILVPYFAKARAEHGDPEDQLAIWQIDAWSVHRSAEFQALRLLDDSKKPSNSSEPFDVSAIQLDKRLKVLRDHSVAWITKAYNVINKPEFVRKAFENSQLEDNPQFNLLHASLTSPAALQALKGLPKMDPELWAELMQLLPESEPIIHRGDREDKAEEQEFEDDLAIPSSALREHLTNSAIAGGGLGHDEKGNIIPVSMAESLDDEAADTNHEFTDAVEDVPEPECGRGHRKRVQEEAEHDDNDIGDEELDIGAQPTDQQPAQPSGAPIRQVQLYFRQKRLLTLAELFNYSIEHGWDEFWSEGMKNYKDKTAFYELVTEMGQGDGPDGSGVSHAKTSGANGAAGHPIEVVD
ncbi:hypothetical protein EWM64_g8235 [Hericium alpestre]|uniref:DDE-1 domain-containing protein n=1 Tax=Hericium alpestre TaxID=135208 RepID=A0A4Y9ZLP4_9AGAM|nr:hypothetical protein EWM64_g8235 [Hericium alpestre]